MSCDCEACTLVRSPGDSAAFVLPKRYRVEGFSHFLRPTDRHQQFQLAETVYEPPNKSPSHSNTHMAAVEFKADLLKRVERDANRVQHDTASCSSQATVKERTAVQVDEYAGNRHHRPWPKKERCVSMPESPVCAPYWEFKKYRGRGSNTRRLVLNVCKTSIITTSFSILGIGVL